MKLVPNLNFITQAVSRLPGVLLVLIGGLAVGQTLTAFRETEEAIAQESETERRVERTFKARVTEESLVAKKRPDFAPALEKALRPLVYPWNQVLSTLEQFYGERSNIVRFEQQVNGTIKLLVVGQSFDNIEVSLDRLNVFGGDYLTWSVQSISRRPTDIRAVIEGRTIQ